MARRRRPGEDTADAIEADDEVAPGVRIGIFEFTDLFNLMGTRAGVVAACEMLATQT